MASCQFKVVGNVTSIAPSKSGKGLNVWVELDDGEKARIFAGTFSKGLVEKAKPGQPITAIGKLKCTPKTLANGFEVVDYALFLDQASLGPVPEAPLVPKKEAEEELPW